MVTVTCRPAAGPQAPCTAVRRRHSRGAGPPMASLDAQQYAEALRKSLMEGLFDGDDLDVDGEADTDSSSKGGPLTAGEVSKLLDASAGTAGGIAAGQAGLLADLGTELEQLSGHEIIKNIMDQASVPLATSSYHTAGAQAEHAASPACCCNQPRSACTAAASIRAHIHARRSAPAHVQQQLADQYIA